MRSALSTHLHALLWCYRLHSDIEEISKYTWHRYLGWLLDKHKGSRSHKLITAKTSVIHNRTRWTAEICEGESKLFAYQWLPTRQELKRRRYPQKGKDGFLHPYIFSGTPTFTDYPMEETGPAERIYTDTIGARNDKASRNEPLEMTELKLRAKMRDGFRCIRCGNTEHLRVHHTKGTKSHHLNDLETLCLKCHHAKHNYRQK